MKSQNIQPSLGPMGAVDAVMEAPIPAWGLCREHDRLSYEPSSQAGLCGHRAATIMRDRSREEEQI